MSAAVETKVSQVKVSFTATFDGVSGFPDGVGAFTSSPLVELDGKSWTMRIYPGGFNEESAGFLSCFVSYHSKGSIRAAYTISVINQKGWKNHFVKSNGVKDFRDNALDPFSIYGEAKFLSNTDMKTPASGVCVDDKIIIKVDLTTYGEVEQHIKSSCAQNLGSPARVKTIHDELSGILFKSSSSDVVIKAGAESIHAHSFILSLRSEVFRAMFNSPMKESETREIIIPDFEAPVIKDFLSFIYTDRCDQKVLEQHGELLLAMACKYQVMGLETHCENFLCATLTVQNVVNLLCLADMYGANNLKHRSLQFIAHNAKIVIEAPGFFDSLGFQLCQEVLKAVAGVGEAFSSHGSCTDSSNNSVGSSSKDENSRSRSGTAVDG